jgi:tetratricopeptide (TPR) repeat protein
VTDLVGTTLGQYQIVELIGEGGMASVYKAWQPSLRRYVALKVLAPHLANDAEFHKRFQQEAVSAANLKHTNIVTIHDVGAEGDHHYIAMEFIEGASLTERIRSGQAVAPEQVVDVISQIGSALDYAHQRGFIHRDIKPANILIEPGARAVLTDFGIAKAVSGGVTGPLTKAGSIFGTPHYMSPEQVREEELDHRSDLYSLGIVCYEMLSGEVPFDGTTTHSILYAQANNPPPPLREVNPSVLPPVEAVVNRMLAKNRERRYNSAGEFAMALAQAVVGVWPEETGEATVVGGGAPTGAELVETVVGRGAARPMTMPAPVRRGRWPVVLGAVAVGVMVIVGAVVGVMVLGKEDLLKRAQESLATGDYIQAADRFSRVLESDPDSVEAIGGQLEAAANLAQVGQFDAAIAAYEMVWQARPEEVRALQGLGEAYEAKGEWGEAVNWYERWTQAAPEDQSAFLALGSAHLNLGEYEGAVAAYERADALGADAAEVDVPLGLAYYELAMYNQAVERLQNAVNRNPEDFPLQRALGLSLYNLGQIEGAVERLNKAVALSAGRSGDELRDIYYALGSFYFGEQDREQAISFYEKARALDPEGQAVGAEEARDNLDQAYVENAMQDVLLDLDFSNIVSEGGENYAIAKTGQKVKIEGAVHLVDGPWEGSQALVVEEGTENLCTNPSIEIDTTGWNTTGGNAPTVTRDPAEPHRGTASLEVATTNAGDNWWDAVVNNAGNDYTFKRNTQYTISFWAKASQVISDVYVCLKMDHAPWSSYGTYVDVGTEWEKYAVTVTWESADDNNVRHPEFGFGLLPAGIDIWIDEVQVEEKSYATTYCDGDQGNGYSWSDTPHRSTSIRTATFIDAGPADDLIGNAGTISAWVRWRYDYDGVWPNDYPRICDSGKRTNERFLMYYDVSSQRIALMQINGGVTSVAETEADFSAGEWVHVVTTWDGSYLRIYYNSELGDTVQGQSGNPNLQGAVLYIGDSSGHMRQLYGDIAEFVVFDRALTTQEVAALYRVDGPVSK